MTTGQIIIDAVVKANALQEAHGDTSQGFVFVWQPNAAEQIEAALSEMGYRVVESRQSIDDLCLRMLAHAAFAEGCDDMKVLEIRQRLEPFFGKERINRCVDILCGQSQPEPAP